MLKTGYFVTGTDTGIGKTVVATILTIGFQAKYWKPIQTGAGEGTDSAFVRNWAGAPCVLAETYRFEEPVSPHLAAHSNGTAIELGKILSDAAELASPAIVEGAGGVLVPLAPHFLMADLMLALELPVVVVASARVGTINHTLLTLEALRRREIGIAGVVLIGDQRDSPWRSIELYGETTVLGHVPRTDRFSPSWFREAFSALSLEISQEIPCKAT